jgi:hypothetical protein
VMSWDKYMEIIIVRKGIYTVCGDNVNVWKYSRCSSVLEWLENSQT